MKRLIITEEEKQRILQMHESAIKKNYLIEEENTPTEILKVDSIQSAIYTTCNPQKQSTWVYTKKDIDADPVLKGVNWATLFKESSMGSRFGVQNGLIWEFKQAIERSSLTNTYNFYILNNGGGIEKNGTVKYSCNSSWSFFPGSGPSEISRENLFPGAIMMTVTGDYFTSPDNVKIPADIVIKLLNLIKSQPNLNPTVASAIKTATEGNLKPYGYFDENMIKMIKDTDMYKSLGGI